MPETTFHKPGVIYFWVLNDELRDADVDRMIDAFVEAEVAAVCLHPRPGLLLPYGGDDWFAFIRRTVERCAQRGLDAWLYDEDPYPSGACGGLLVMENPHHTARAIEHHQADPTLQPGALFTFPAGILLWCGLVHDETGEVRDLTGRVGVVRQRWELLDPWDSRWYYPNTPLYYCARSDTYDPELAVRVPEVPAGFTLRAFVARPTGGNSVWGTLPDTLNPEVTHRFIERTHERYAACVGEHFGKTVRAMFTDEAKYFGGTPWTPGMCESFEKQFGYDLRPRLWDLFSSSNEPRVMLTRLHYRQWLGERFTSAWLEPVASWCAQHDLPLVGHISPEDDPIEQAACISNLMPLFKHFSLAGIDLIIPAVGDEKHPLINLGVVCATSAAQQGEQPGVLSESLGASGLDADVELATRVLTWQGLMGVTAQVLHGAFQSTEGMRHFDAPPDWGPHSPRWEGMKPLGQRLAQVQAVTTDARQIAPVAVLWPIRSFQAQANPPYSHDAPLRDALADLIYQCLARQVGVHVIDEAALSDLAVHDGEAHLGKARYSHVIVPPCEVLHERSVAALRRLRSEGIDIQRVGEGPRWVQGDGALAAADMDDFEAASTAAAVERLPRLVALEADRPEVRCTVWEKDGRRTALLMTLGQEPCEVALADRTLTLEPGRVQMLEADAPQAVAP